MYVLEVYAIQAAPLGAVVEQVAAAELLFGLLAELVVVMVVVLMVQLDEQVQLGEV